MLHPAVEEDSELLKAVVKGQQSLGDSRQWKSTAMSEKMFRARCAAQGCPRRLSNQVIHRLYITS